MKKITIIAGHYGVGKTNIAVALAMELRKEAGKAAIADLDIVNPYFRVADNASMLREHDIVALIPPYANTNVDIPTLPESFRTVFDTDIPSVLDVGGDDDGAIVLAAYTAEIEACGYDMYCVINMYRPMIAEPAGAAAYLAEMEKSSGLRFTGLINNSNLGEETTVQTVLDSLPYAEEVSRLTGLPVVMTTALSRLSPGLDSVRGIKYIENTTKQLF